MNTVMSKDGTRIAFDQVGAGPLLVLVPGGLQHRAFDEDTGKLAELLAADFTVIHYDRRGRGDSGDTLPYAVEREIEDIEALIDAGGGSAYVYGISSGAALGMLAAVKLGSKIKKLVMYEAPFDAKDDAKQGWMQYTQELNALLAENRREDAVNLFLELLGTPPEELQQFSSTPVYPLFVNVAPTLAYDAAILGAESDVPVEVARQVTQPVLLMHGDAETPYLDSMRATVETLAGIMPRAETRVLAGQTHFVEAEALAPVLVGYFRD